MEDGAREHRRIATHATLSRALQHAQPVRDDPGWHAGRFGARG
jgi:hypothetical protein